MKATEIMEGGKKEDLKTPLSTLMIEDGERKHKLELFSTYKNEDDYFVYFRNTIFRVAPAVAKLFMKHHQDFWLKRPFGKGVKNLTQLNFSLSNKKESYQFYIPFDQDFVIHSMNPNLVLNHANFQKLFLLLFGSDKGDDAFRVSKLSNHYKKAFDKEDLLLKVQDRKFKIIRKNSEVIILDMDSDILFHYMVRDSDFSFSIESFLK